MMCLEVVKRMVKIFCGGMCIHADRMTSPSYFGRTSIDDSGSRSESSMRAFCLQCTGQKKDISTSTAIHFDLIRHL
jgi:hypothetical protein